MRGENRVIAKSLRGVRHRNPIEQQRRHHQEAVKGPVKVFLPYPARTTTRPRPSCCQLYSRTIVKYSRHLPKTVAGARS